MKIFKRVKNNSWHYYHDIIECLISALEAKDAYTSGHSERVAHLSYDIGQKYGMNKKKLQQLHLAGHLHDIGKIGIPDNILNKPGRLHKDEFEIIKTHSKVGYEILSKSKKLEEIAIIVLHHHERWDGKGYPNGLKGEEIPLSSRIISLSDSIDAMVTKRPYKKSFTLDQCIEEVKNNRGIQFDPQLVDIVLDIYKQGKLNI